MMVSALSGHGDQTGHTRVAVVVSNDVGFGMGRMAQMSAEATNARVQSVQSAVAKYGGSVCPVLLTDIEPAGWSAAYIDTITQQFNATIPAPRLPQRQSSGSGGSGDGGGGSGQ